jgi:hypothetical protein
MSNFIKFVQCFCSENADEWMHRIFPICVQSMHIMQRMYNNLHLHREYCIQNRMKNRREQNQGTETINDRFTAEP